MENFNAYILYLKIFYVHLTGKKGHKKVLYFLNTFIFIRNKKIFFYKRLQVVFLLRVFFYRRNRKRNIFKRESDNYLSLSFFFINLNDYSKPQTKKKVFLTFYFIKKLHISFFISNEK